MTKDDIIRMAQEADGHHDALERFAALVAAAEREACAMVAEEFGPGRPIAKDRPGERVIGRWEGEQAASGSIAAAIRARGQA